MRRRKWFRKQSSLTSATGFGEKKSVNSEADVRRIIAEVNIHYQKYEKKKVTFTYISMHFFVCLQDLDVGEFGNRYHLPISVNIYYVPEQ